MAVPLDYEKRSEVSRPKGHVFQLLIIIADACAIVACVITLLICVSDFSSRLGAGIGGVLLIPAILIFCGVPTGIYLAHNRKQIPLNRLWLLIALPVSAVILALLAAVLAYVLPHTGV